MLEEVHCIAEALYEKALSRMMYSKRELEERRDRDGAQGLMRSQRYSGAFYVNIRILKSILTEKPVQHEKIHMRNVFDLIKITLLRGKTHR